MGPRRLLCLLCGGLLFLCPASWNAAIAQSDEPPWVSPPPPAISLQPEAVRDLSTHRIEATIINPYREADVGTQVAGVIQAVNFDEGDRIEKGQVVVEIDPVRYKLAVEKARERVRVNEAAFKLAETQLRVKKELFELDSATQQELLRAESELETAKYRLAESRVELRTAMQDLKDCTVEGPFSGYMTIRYKEPFEPVRPLEPLFAMVDSERVYAVAYVPEELLDVYKQGVKAVFVHRSGEEYTGVVERVGKLIDPKTRTKKVYVLIDNPEGLLEVGMTGSLQLWK